MSLKTIVKVGAITNLSDARYCAGMGVDMLGFCFSEKSNNYIEIDKFKEISNWVSGVEIIAEFENETIAKVEEVLAAHDFDGVMTSNFDVAKALKSQDKKVIMLLNIESKDDINAFKEKVNSYAHFDFVQVTAHHRKKYPELIELLINYSCTINFIKAFDNNKEELEIEIKDGLFKGIALMGSHEEKPGMKDYDEIADILELLDEDY